MFEDPHAFCNNTTKVRVRSDGVQVWRCNGHDVSKGEPLRPVEELPANLQGKPLANLTMIEVFGGQQEEGGAVFARAWLAAGGAVEAQDMCLEGRERFEDIAETTGRQRLAARAMIWASAYMSSNSPVAR